MNIKDIELTVPGDRCHVNIVTRRKERLTDGKRHTITIIYPDSTREVRLGNKIIKERSR